MLVVTPGDHGPVLKWINSLRKQRKLRPVGFIMPGEPYCEWGNPVCESLKEVAYGDGCRRLVGRTLHLKIDGRWWKTTIPNSVYLFLWDFNNGEYPYLVLEN